MGASRRNTFSPPPASHADADELTVPEQLLHERVRALFSLDFLRSVLTQGRADLRDSKLSPPVVAVLLLTFVLERLPSLLNVLDKARVGLVGGLPALSAQPTSPLAAAPRARAHPLPAPAARDDTTAGERGARAPLDRAPGPVRPWHHRRR